MLSWGSVAKIAPFLEIFETYVDTDLETDEILYFASQALYMDLDEGLASRTLKGRGDAIYNGYTWCFELDREQTMADINELLNPYKTPVTHEMVHIMKGQSYST